MSELIKKEASEIIVPAKTISILGDFGGNLGKAFPDMNIDIDCYVLEDGQRVLSWRGASRATGFAEGSGSRMIRMLKETQAIQKYLSPALLNIIDKHDNHQLDRFKGKVNGKTVHGDIFPADLLVDIADAFHRARISGDLRIPKHIEFADNLYTIMKVFSKVGITALVDEVTGYQNVRGPRELQEKARLYIAEEFRVWQKMFPEVFFEEVIRLYGLDYNPESTLRPVAASRFIEVYVYSLFPKEAIKHIKSNKGWRKIHQGLSDEIGVPQLNAVIQQVLTLAQISDNIDEFRNYYEKKYKKTTQPVVM